MEFKTDQEIFWAGEFGNEYIKRNQNETDFISNIALFSKIFSHTNSISSFLELGSNIGLNLKAIKTLMPKAQLSAIEINSSAIEELKKIKDITVYHSSILDFIPNTTYDFVFIKTVLIHINPDELPKAYELLYKSANRYICIAEYYNPTPVQIKYRGHEDKLFKRDFAGEIMELYKDLKLLDYGFVYHGDAFPQDDITWFLLVK